MILNYLRTLWFVETLNFLSYKQMLNLEIGYASIYFQIIYRATEKIF